jgi:ATP-binding cassette, subfamily A (ABC1), member 3
MQLLLRQIWTLAWKDLLLLLNRKRRIFTYLRALWGPIILTVYLSIIVRVYWPKENYGIGSPTGLRSLAEGFGAAGGGRNTLALVNYGPTGGEIEKVINAVAKEASLPGKTVKILTSLDELLALCRSTLYGTTKCYGAAEFFTSPTEGGIWNYTLRSDGALGVHTDVTKDTNDEQIYPLPLQRAIDAAIASVNGTNTTNSLPSTVSEYPYTRQTQQQWIDSIKVNIHKATVNYIAVVWYLGLIGLAYQLVGVMAREREYGMAELLESMMPNKRRWEPQIARMAGRFVAFTLVSTLRQV